MLPPDPAYLLCSVLRRPSHVTCNASKRTRRFIFGPKRRPCNNNNVANLNDGFQQRSIRRTSGGCTRAWNNRKMSVTFVAWRKGWVDVLQRTLKISYAWLGTKSGERISNKRCRRPHLFDDDFLVACLKRRVHNINIKIGAQPKLLSTLKSKTPRKLLTKQTR